MVAAGGDDAVGGVLEPGPQAAGQAGVEARPGRAVAPQQREHLPPCAGALPVAAAGGAGRSSGRGATRTMAQCAHRV